MIEIEVKGSRGPEALADLIASTLHGHPGASPDDPMTEVGKRVRAEQEAAEITRPSQQEMETVNFQTIDDDLDFSEL